MNFFERRRLRKTGQDILRHAEHIRNMREDLLKDDERRKLDEAAAGLREALKGTDLAAIERTGNELYACAGKAAPARHFAGVRENLEILVVAVAVAMAFRSYFIQPFKIPTGSMQPTLFGIHSAASPGPGLWDRLPLKVFKWVVWGEWYKEFIVTVPGELRVPAARDDAGAENPGIRYCYVGANRYDVPKDARLNYEPGAYVSAGSVLWSGIVTAGDHVFVDKVRWNFSRPQRGCIMVFKTDGIQGLQQGTHYIKRMAGKPGDSVSINSPYLIVNGKEVMDPLPVAKITRKEPPYDRPPYGYGFIPPNAPQGYLKTPMEVLHLKEHQYLGLGDNTANSSDGRYWGTVPESNLVGPARMVYWPVSSRWGFAR